MSWRERVLSLFKQSTTDTTSTQSDVEEPPLLDDLDIELPPGAPEVCPNCGDPVDAVVPPDLDQRVRLGPMTKSCHVGSLDQTPLAGWRVIHR